MNRHVALYERVSTEHQAKEGVSLDAQTANLRRTAKGRHPGCRTKEYRDEGRSGREGKDRPQFEALRQAIQAGQVEHVYATKIDRIARSIADLVAFLRLCAAHGTGVTTLQTGELMDGAAAKLLVNILGVVAEFESDLRSERITEVNDHLRASGRFVGKPPWGYIKQGRDIVPSADAPLILRAFELFAEGHTKAQVMRWLNAQPREYRLKPLRQDNMHRLLSNPVYAGFVVSDTKSGAPTITQGAHKPIVPPELFERVQGLLIERKGKGYHGDRLLPYAGLTRCGECTAPLRHASDGDWRHYVGCSAFCGLPAWPAPYFELFVIAHIDAFGAWIDKALADGSWRRDRNGRSATTILGELEATRTAREELKSLVRRGALTASEGASELKANLEALRRLEDTYASATQTDAEAEAKLRAYRESWPAEDFKSWWVEASDEERERVLPQIVARIYLNDGSIGFVPTYLPAGPLLIFETKRQRQRSTVVDALARDGFLGVKRGHDQEAATLLRSLRRARSAGRNRSPPCAAPRARD